MRCLASTRPASAQKGKRPSERLTASCRCCWPAAAQGFLPPQARDKWDQHSQYTRLLKAGMAGSRQNIDSKESKGLHARMHFLFSPFPSGRDPGVCTNKERVHAMISATVVVSCLTRKPTHRARSRVRGPVPAHPEGEEARSKVPGDARRGVRGQGQVTRDEVLHRDRARLHTPAVGTAPYHRTHRAPRYSRLRPYY